MAIQVQKHEYKVMGLAPYADKNTENIFSNWIDLCTEKNFVCYTLNI